MNTETAAGQILIMALAWLAYLVVALTLQTAIEWRNARKQPALDLDAEQKYPALLAAHSRLWEIINDMLDSEWSTDINGYRKSDGTIITDFDFNTAKDTYERLRDDLFRQGNRT